MLFLTQDNDFAGKECDISVEEVPPLAPLHTSFFCLSGYLLPCPCLPEYHSSSYLLCMSVLDPQPYCGFPVCMARLTAQNHRFVQHHEPRIMAFKV